ncbi:acyltransferase family protein [Streptomyces cellulosae]|uniref:acyltransferase family protein n=1 Tax=Streptomyces cellulosae TaxID=1968 RepID=UPI0004CBD267|nr:acyltransferase [Streptomyces cellulosae]
MAMQQTPPSELIRPSVTTSGSTEPAGTATDTGEAPRVGNRAVRLPSLTGMRFPAALLVFLFHVSLPAGWLMPGDANSTLYARLVEQTGGVGVTFFFVLSGFVLAWSAREGDPSTSFWRRRYVKIVPNYLVAWALAMLLTAAGTAAWRSGVTFFMLQSWVPDYDTNFSVNAPGWSLSTEVFFYLCFPLLFAGVRRIAPRRLKFWIVGVIAGVAVTPWLAITFIPAGDVYMSNEPGVSGLHLWFAYVFPPARLLDFLLGILVARAVMLGRWRDIGLVPAGLLFVASYVIAELPGMPYLFAQRAVCLVPCALLIAAGALADASGRPTPFRSRAMVWLGEVSFAFYLLHFIVVSEARNLLGARFDSVPAVVALVVAECALAVLVSWAMYAWIEKPLVRRWSRARAKTPEAATVA